MDLRSLRIISYNCGSFKSNVEIVNLLLEDCDILLLQETLLPDYCSDLLCINDNFDYSSVAATRNSDTFFGRSSGGLAIYWRKCLSSVVEVFEYSSRIMGLYLNFASSCYLLVNVYLPCDYRTHESLISYRSCLSEIQSICFEKRFDEIIISGDMNCDPDRGRFYDEITALADNLSLFFCDVLDLGNDSYTYISRNSHCSTSWLDHVLAPDSSLINKIRIRYGVSFDDHIPLQFCLKVPNVTVRSNYNVPHSPCSYVLWHLCTREHLFEYGQFLDYLMIDVDFESLLCSDNSCSSENHKVNLDVIYDYLLDCIFAASATSLPMATASATKHRVIGWNSRCKNLYMDARKKFQEWNFNGKIRHGTLFDDMKTSRSLFKKALRYCRNNEVKLKKEKVAMLFASNNKLPFWRNLNSINSKIKSPASRVDGFTDSKDILNVFETEYISVLNNPTSQTIPPDFVHLFANKRRAEDVIFRLYFSESRLDTAVTNLKYGIGWDLVHSNHLRYSGEIFRRVLGNFFSSCLKHGYLPRPLLFGEIKPILKSNKVSKSDSKNYRPIMSSSALLKLFEYCLLPILERYIRLSSRQFGFRKGSNCIHAGVLLRETITRYKNLGSDVHCAMLDLSKAFDSVNSKILAVKLLETGIPFPVVQIIHFMCDSTYVRVVFNDIKGLEWKIGNGVRQGGILSPLLFNLYINDLLNDITKLNVGCKLIHMSCNIFCYADDIALLCPSANGLQYLIDKVEGLVRNLCLNLNSSKSAYMVFTNRKLNTSIRCAGNVLNRVNEFKYLGCIFTSTLAIDKDVDRLCASFLAQFNCLYHKFSSFDSNVLFFLFKSYCFSFYGCELWFDFISKPYAYRKLSVAYHKSVKRIANMNVWDSNHIACMAVGIPTMKHFLAERSLSFLWALTSTESPCLMDFKYYLKYASYVSRAVVDLFRRCYGVQDLFDNDYRALLSRIMFVQANEPHSSYRPNTVTR